MAMENDDMRTEDDWYSEDDYCNECGHWYEDCTCGEEEEEE